MLSQVLATAVEGGRLARNPAAGVRLPKRIEREMLFLDAAQVEQLGDAIGSRYRVLVYFLAYTGLRFGEAVARKTKRLDLLRPVARWSSRPLRWAAHSCGTHKTNERRTVRLPHSLVKLLATPRRASRPGSGCRSRAPSTRPIGGPDVVQLRKRPGQ